MTQDWTAVDGYIAGKLIGADPVLDAALAANAEGGLPAIDVSAAQGRMLELFARMTGARRILEVGTLGGYSTICLARALPEDGQLVTLELDPHHAEVARANLARAGLGDRCEVRVGPAVETLAAMIAAGEGPFDLYLDAALKLARPGSVIVVDNVVRGGGVLDADSTDRSVIGTRALFDAVASEPRLDATAIQTVGDKGWDGFLLAVVKR